MNFRAEAWNERIVILSKGNKICCFNRRSEINEILNHEKIKLMNEEEQKRLRSEVNIARAKVFNVEYSYIQWIKSLSHSKYYNVNIDILVNFFNADLKKRLLHIEHKFETEDHKYYISHKQYEHDKDIINSVIAFFEMNPDIVRSYKIIREANFPIDYFFLYDFKKTWEIKSVLES